MLSIMSVTLAFIMGIIWGLYVEFNLFIALNFLSVIMLAILIFNSKFKNISKYINQIFCLLIILIIGYAYTSVRLNDYKQKYKEGEVQFIVTIISHYSQTDYNYKYYAKNENDDKFLIYFKKNEESIFDIGTTLYINGEFELPSVKRNEGGFDYRKYLNSNNVYGIIKVSHYEKQEKEIKNPIYILQNFIRDKLLKLFPIEYAGILNGMLIGEVSDIPTNVMEYFEGSGITHLLAVSGSNVALIIIISKFIFSRIIGNRFSNYFVIIFIIFFTLLSGASPSVLRAGIMAILDILANILIKKSSSINNILMSALIILLINPITLVNIGFILSFFGTIGIISFSKSINDNLTILFNKIINPPEFLIETISVTLSAQIVLLPIMAYCFNSISIISIFTNILVVPISSILTIVGFIIIVVSCIYFPLSKLISNIVFYMIKFIVDVAKYFSKISALNLTVVTPKIWVIIIYYISLYFIANFSKLKCVAKKLDIKIVRTKNIICILIILVLVGGNIIARIPKKYIELSIIDVGQGDSFFIVTPKNKTILIDGGGSETGSYDVGKNILLPYILDRGYKKIDLIFISHAHADHIDGIFTIIENLKVGKIVIGPQLCNDEKITRLNELCNKNKVDIIHVSRGDELKIDNVNFEILYPNKNEKDENINNLSLIIKMNYAGRSVLFTGDIEEKAEEKIKGNLRSDILKIAHHGANTSTSEAFLKKVKPEIAIISVAEKNNYGHPHSNVIERIKKYAKVYMTKDSGEIRIRIYNNSKIFINECIKSHN